jgi:hypothetical protein
MQILEMLLLISMSTLFSDTDMHHVICISETFFEKKHTNKTDVLTDVMGVEVMDWQCMSAMICCRNHQTTAP